MTLNENKLKCLYCKRKIGNNIKRIEWANIDHKYRRELDDFIPLCRSCHIKYDNKLRKKNANK